MKIKPYSKQATEIFFAKWLDLAEKQDSPDLKQWMKNAPQQTDINDLLLAVAGNSPYLLKLLLDYPHIIFSCFEKNAKTTYNQLLLELDEAAHSLTAKDLAKKLRIYKGKISLLIALADLAGWWSLEEITNALSNFASASLTHSINTLLTEASKREEITLSNKANPSLASGIIILGMGKLGGYELNYSSDIDIIILFEQGKLEYKGRHNQQHFMNKFAHDLVNIMHERTADGYVFRTDLRLRPDPSATPPAISSDAAYYYYESVGQNWERAAMIKARPVAGDIDAGEEFLKNISPFMWRRSLDFASIRDIHSIKRQMDSQQRKETTLAGHDIKLGAGGIREIEFFAQIHQLIWGGRLPKLRSRNTCETIKMLCQLEQINKKTRNALIEAYHYYRKLEHRLQMINDEQTHSLPTDPEQLQQVSCFMGYGNIKSFKKEAETHLKAVHHIFANSFKSSEKLGDQGNLVFTGVSHDPETLKTLEKMGYTNPETISEIIMGWHHGSKRATRTKRSRQILTELMPVLIKSLSETANPDSAFLKFNEFLANLPAGVQLFSLFNINPQLLTLVADIMGSAPALAENLSRSPDLLDGALYNGFYSSLPNKTFLQDELNERLTICSDFESRINLLGRFKNEKQFQAGVQLLKHIITAEESGTFLSDLAELLLNKALQIVENEFQKSHGNIDKGHFAIIALGKLGSCEMTFASDIDLVFIYDAPEDALSDGNKQFNSSVYYNRLAQRLVNILSSIGHEGRLYEVDTRLRPSGQQGLLASNNAGLAAYFEKSAWTFEYMAFTKARAISGSSSLCKELNKFIEELILQPRDGEKLKKDVAEMRTRISKEFPASNIWDIKYIQGGLVDCDFLAQYLLLLHAPQEGCPAKRSTQQIIKWLKEKEIFDPQKADKLEEANRSLSTIFNMLRLCSDGKLDEATAMPGLKILLSKSLKLDDFSSLKQRLIELEQTILEQYNFQLDT